MSAYFFMNHIKSDTHSYTAAIYLYVNRFRGFTLMIHKTGVRVYANRHDKKSVLKLLNIWGLSAATQKRERDPLDSNVQFVDMRVSVCGLIKTCVII